MMRRTIRCLRFLAAMGVVAVLAGAPEGRADPPEFLPPVQVGTVQSPDIPELSGMAVSHQNPGVIWANNDGPETGNLDPETYFFALTAAGTHLGRWNLVDATNTDWEDMTLGPGPVPGTDYVYLGDIGNNYLYDRELILYRVPEPTVSATQDPPLNVDLYMSAGDFDKIILHYPDGNHDCDTLMIDRTNGDIYVISRYWDPMLYRATGAAYLAGGSVVTLEAGVLLPSTWHSSSGNDGRPTAGDISPNGLEMLVRSYHKCSLFTRQTTADSWFTNPEVVLPIAVEPHGEAISFDAQGLDYYTISELEGAADQPIYYYQRVPMTISGYVKTRASLAIPAVTVSADNGGGADTTNGNGEYSLTVPYGWSGMITPNLRDVTFVPPARSYAALTSDQANQDFTGSLPGDANGDGTVNLSDFTPISVNFLRTGMTWEEGDFTGDGTVNLTDFAALSVHFQQSIVGTGQPPVGEVITADQDLRGPSSARETAPDGEGLPCTALALVLLTGLGLSFAGLKHGRSMVR